MADENEEGTGKKKDVKDQEELNKLTDQELQKLKSKIDLLAEARGLTEDIMNLTEVQLENQKAMAELLRDTAAIIGDRREQNQQSLNLLELQAKEMIKQKATTDEQMKEYKLAIDEIIKFGSTQRLAYAELDESEKSILENLEKEASIKRGNELLDKGSLKIADKLVESVGIRARYKDSLFASSAKLLKNLTAEGQAGIDARNAMKEYVAEAFSLQNIALNIFNAIKDNSISMLKSFDSASAALAKSTGQGRKFQETMYDVTREGNQFGISMDNAGQAIGTLVSQTSNFTNLSKATAQNIALTVAQMEKLGVSTSDSAQIFQNFNQGLGIAAEEAAKMQVELAMAGTSIGIDAAKITKDFNASLSTLMVYGRESVDVFKGIAAAAKAAGVETSTLLGVAKRFDTFAGAAEGVGKLNALLGTQLSTTEMLMATEDERIRMLVESVQSSGVAFQDMNKYQQLAIANAAGITDMAEANRIFGMSLEAYDENERKLKESADAQKKMEEALAPTVKLMDTMKILGQEMVVALKPVIEKLQEWADAAREFFGDMDTETKELWAGVGLLVSGLLLLAPIFASGGMLLTGMATTVGTLGMMAGGTTATATGIAATGTAAAAATPALAGMAAPLGAIAAELVAILGPIALIAIGIGIVTVAFAAFAYAVVELIKPLFGIISDFLNFVYDGFSGIGSIIASAFSTSDADLAMEEFRTRSVEAMADIAMSIGSDDTVVERTKAMVDEINKLGQDVRVSSTIENLALLTAGTATSITGEKVKASTTNVTAKVQNFFQGMEMTLSVDGAEFKGYVESVSEKVAGEVAGGERVV